MEGSVNDHHEGNVNEMVTPIIVNSKTDKSVGDIYPSQKDRLLNNTGEQSYEFWHSKYDPRNYMPDEKTLDIFSEIFDSSLDD